MSRPSRLLACTITLVFLGCPDKSATPDPATTARTLTRNAGDGQSAIVGQAVATAPSVKLTNAAGGPVSGVVITFAVVSGGGTLTAATPTTDALGVATVGSWILGQAAGANTLTAAAAGTVSGSPVTFTATGSAAPAASLTKQAGDAQQGPAGQPVAIAPAVLIKDQFGNPVGNVAVTFAVASGGGSVTGGTQTTGATGVATVVSWRLGNATGPNTLSATATGAGIAGNPATFTATGNGGAPAVIAKSAGDMQSAVVGTAVATAPTVRVTDAAGNNVSGAGVTFAVASGGGSVTGGSQLTAIDGTAKPITWTLGPATGANTMTASAVASGVSGGPLTFTATGIAGLNVAAMAGNWSGTWTDPTHGINGTVTLVIAAGMPANTATITLSVSGPVFGGGEAPRTLSNLPYTAAAFTVQGVDPRFGNVTINVDANGNMVGSGVDVPLPAWKRWDWTGTITTTQIRLNFTATARSGGTAVGTMSINKQ